MRKGGTAKSIRLILFLIILTWIVFVFLEKKHNYTDIHRRVRELEMIHGI